MSAPTHTGGSWNVDRFVRRLASGLHQRGLLVELSEKALARVTAALAHAFETRNLDTLPAHLDREQTRRTVEAIARIDTAASHGVPSGPDDEITMQDWAIVLGFARAATAQPEAPAEYATGGAS